MDNQRYGIRATGDYAIFDGIEYFAHRYRQRIWLYSDDSPLPSGFSPTETDWIKGEKLVELSEITRLSTSQTTCTWRGHPFRVGIIVGDIADVTYIGQNFDEVCKLPGMNRSDKYEVIGEIPVSELTDIREHLVEVLLDNTADEKPRRDQT